MGLKFSDFFIDKQQQEQAEKALSDKEYLEQQYGFKTAPTLFEKMGDSVVEWYENAFKSEEERAREKSEKAAAANSGTPATVIGAQKETASTPTAPTASTLDIAGIKAGAASSSSAADADVTESESDKYYALQKEYIDKYLGREDFAYDVSADELYQQFRKQALDTADKARRNATAEAAGLTGGYGSSYALAAGNSAYSDIMQNADAMLPEFMELARSRYDAEGKDLLSRADILGELGDSITERESAVQKSYLALLDALGGDGDNGEDVDRDSLLASERAVNNASFKYDGSYKDYKGNTTAAALVNAMLEDGISRTDILKELKSITSDDKDDEDGYRFSASDLEYIEGLIDSYEDTAYINGLVDEAGASLADYYNQLVAAAESGELTAEEVIYALTSWKDKDGKGLDEQTLLSLIG